MQTLILLTDIRDDKEDNFKRVIYDVVAKINSKQHFFSLFQV
jgi:hypothetical protein